MDAFSYGILSLLKQKLIFDETTRRAFEVRYLLSPADPFCD